MKKYKNSAIKSHISLKKLKKRAMKRQMWNKKLMKKQMRHNRREKYNKRYRWMMIDYIEYDYKNK